MVLAPQLWSHFDMYSCTHTQAHPHPHVQLPHRLLWPHVGRMLTWWEDTVASHVHLAAFGTDLNIYIYVSLLELNEGKQDRHHTIFFLVFGVLTKEKTRCC